MMIDPQDEKALTQPTHYSYLSGPNGMREVTKTFDLTNAPVVDRRKLIAYLLRTDGEILAPVPFGLVANDIEDVRLAVKWLYG